MGESTPDAAHPAAYNCYAAQRWVQAVRKVLIAGEDPRTMHAWAHLVGASPASLATWCRAARVSPRRGLELARLLRALALTNGRLSELQEVLDIVEPRTLLRMMARSGLGSLVSTTARLSLVDFLDHQTLVQSKYALAVLRASLPADFEHIRTEPRPIGRAASTA